MLLALIYVKAKLSLNLQVMYILLLYDFEVLTLTQFSKEI